MFRWLKDLMVTAPVIRFGGKKLNVKYMTQVCQELEY
jgi:hypothetical protein